MDNIGKKKKSLGKKVLIWFSSLIFISVITIISIPYLFKDKILEMITSNINTNINAHVTFKDANLSLLNNFPLVSVTVHDLEVANLTPFAGDTLFNAKEFSLAMKVTELFKNSDETIAIESITTHNGDINIIFNNKGIGNFDIAIAKEKNSQTDSDNSFSLDIEEYEFANINFNYIDRSTNTKLSLENITHTGKGNFAKDIFNLNTKTSGYLSFDLDKTNYINKVKVTLNAVLGIDLKNSKYTFKENTGFINQLPLEFDGFIQLADKNQFYDLSFKTPTSSFKNALALLPQQYAGNLNTLKTEGNSKVTGFVKGALSDKKIPTFEIQISSKNALFKYADLPKAVKNINIDSKIVNKTGFLKDTYIALNTLNFIIDEDVFSANGSVKNIISNPQINITANGIIDLANIGKVHPAPLEKELVGILNTHVTANFDMNSIENGTYQNIKNSGKITVSDFKYEGADVANPVFINKTSVYFKSNTITLNQFEAKSGTSDLSLNGKLDNFYGFIFKDEILKGNFNLNSNTLIVTDFIAADQITNNNENPTSSLKIPAFLDVKFNANAKKVVYDDIQLSNVRGDLFIHDETIDLKNLKSDVFGGNIGFNGSVSTKGATSKFNMDLDLKQLNIGESFGNLDMLKAIAPIAKTIEGKINSKIKVSGLLNDDMTPDLKSVSGDLFGKLLNPQLNSSNSKVLTLLEEKVDFVSLDKLNLDGINALLSFKNGYVNVKPIPLKYKDIGMIISGKHSFDNSMDYDILFDVPVKYLGTDVTNLIAQLTPTDAASVKSIPVKGTFTGSFGNPNFTSNIKNATATLIKGLVEKQKNSLLNKGKDQLKNLIGIDTKKKDSTKQGAKEKVTDKVKDVLGGLFGKKKKK